jgi:hypothetical protein
MGLARNLFRARVRHGIQMFECPKFNFSASILIFSCLAPFSSPYRVHAEFNTVRCITITGESRKLALPFTVPDRQSNDLCYSAVKFPKTQRT